MSGERCPACGAPLDTIHVAGHYQCARCKTPIESCCEGEAGRETQPSEVEAAHIEGVHIPDPDVIVVKVSVSRAMLEGTDHYEYAQLLGDSVIDVALLQLVLETVDGTVEED